MSCHIVRLGAVAVLAVWLCGCGGCRGTPPPDSPVGATDRPVERVGRESVREWPFRAKVVVTVRRQEASARGVLFSEIEEVLSQHLKELGKEDVRDVISSLNVPAIDGQPVAVAEVADVEIRLIRRDAGADDLRPAGQRGADRRYRDEGWFPARIMVCVQAERARAAGVSLQAAGRVLQQLAPNTEYCVDEIERLPLAGTDATPIPLARVAEVRIFVKVD